VIPDRIVLGNLLVDDMVFPDGRTRMAEPGGATLYAALGASLWRAVDVRGHGFEGPITAHRESQSAVGRGRSTARSRSPAREVELL
jgi:hypothetical protein